MTPEFLAGMNKPGLDSNAPGPGPGLDKKFLSRDQVGTKSWKSPETRFGSRAEISTPCRDPDINLSPAQTSVGHIGYLESRCSVPVYSTLCFNIFVILTNGRFKKEESVWPMSVVTPGVTPSKSSIKHQPQQTKWLHALKIPDQLHVLRS